jgi:DNA-directed RNA polymerase specialized sigma subunit
MKYKMEIVNKKEIPFELSSLILLPSTCTKDVYSFDREGIDKLENLRYCVMDAIDKLSEKDRFIIEAVHYERLTYEELGKRLGCSNVHAWRLTKSAIENLKNMLVQEPTIKEYLGLEANDEFGLG